MVDKFVLGTCVAFGAAALLLLIMNRNLSERNAELKKALDMQTELLKDTQAELEKRDAVILQRDAQIAELEKRTTKAEGKYAQLVRTSKAVQDWDVVLLPDAVGELLRKGADCEAGAAGNVDAGGGHP